MSHPVIHFEILGKDGSALQSFYANTFGWTINADNPMNYGMVAATPPGIAGGVGPSMDGKAVVTVYIEADDLDAALKTIEENGGKTVMATMDVPGGPTIALFSDPEGNLVGLVKGM